MSGRPSSPRWLAGSATCRRPKTPHPRRSPRQRGPGRVDGVPPKPGAWLTVTAWRKAVDQLRAQQHIARAGLSPQAGAVPDATEAADPEVVTMEDDRLGLIFACCHPALAPEVRVALTLRYVAGPDHQGDRRGLPHAGADARAAAGQGQAQDPRRGNPVRGAARLARSRPASPASGPSSTSSSTRATRPPAARAAARRPVRRGDMAWPGAAQAAARRRRMRWPARPDDPDALTRQGPGGRRRPAGAARGPGQERCGAPSSSPKARICSTKPSPVARLAPISCRRPSRRCTRRQRRSIRPTGRRLPHCTQNSHAVRRRQ